MINFLGKYLQIHQFNIRSHTYSNIYPELAKIYIKPKYVLEMHNYSKHKNLINQDDRLHIENAIETPFIFTIYETVRRKLPK